MTAGGDVPLGYVATVRPSSVDKVVVEGETPVRLCNYTDVYYGDRITEDLPLMDASATADEIRRFELRRDDVLITKDSETADDIAIPAWVAEDLPGTVLGYHTSLIRPSSGADGRYLYWALQARPLRAYFEQNARGVTRHALRQQDVTQTPVPCPSFETQRRIADYLDTETTRIDELVHRNRKVEELLHERLRAATLELFDKADDRIPLRYLLRSRPSYGILKPEAVDEGVPVLRIVDVASDGAVAIGGAIQVPEAQSREFARTLLGVGDVVVSVVGTLGRAAVIAPEAAGANISRALARLAPRGIDPTWLASWVRSAEFERLVDEVTAGTAQRVLNMEDLVEFPVPVYFESSAAVKRLRSLEAQTWDAVAALGRQRELLVERRQALISAAVTGDLEV